MKKMILKGLLFFTLSIIFYCLLFLLLNSIRLPFLSSSPLIYFTSKSLLWKGGHTYQSFQEFDINKKYDILILGSSHAYRGYDPRIFEKSGYTTHNLGTSAQSLMNSYFIAKNYIRKENCKMVIFDIFEGPFRADAFEATADIIQNINLDKPALQMAWALRDMRTINMLTLRFLNKNKKAMYGDTTYVGMGFSEKNDSVTQPIDYAGKSAFAAQKGQLGFFRKTLEYFNEQGIEVVIVSHPLPLESDDKKYHEDFKKTVMPVIDEFKIIYLDYTFNHTLNSKNHYYDHNHLNQAGVEIFDSCLINDMKEKKLLW